MMSATLFPVLASGVPSAGPDVYPQTPHWVVWLVWVVVPAVIAFGVAIWKLRNAPAAAPPPTTPDENSTPGDPLRCAREETTPAPAADAGTATLPSQDSRNHKGAPMLPAWLLTNLQRRLWVKAAV